jgi:hypothetical protein
VWKTLNMRSNQWRFGRNLLVMKGTLLEKTIIFRLYIASH